MHINGDTSKSEVPHINRATSRYCGDIKPNVDRKPRTMVRM